jgi:hypothetical protein
MKKTNSQPTVKVKAPTKLSLRAQKLLALWAAECAAHVLPLFAVHQPDDARPRQAIAAARAWARDEIKCGPARQAAVATHAAAREANNAAACAVARAAGHAAGTAHMVGHARHAATYARQAISADIAERGLPSTAGVAKERQWQRRRLPKALRAVIFPPLKPKPKRVA